MANLSYSIDAKNVRNEFFRVEKMLYVEGDDDIPFWEFIFKKLNNNSVRVEKVGGKPQLKKYVEEVVSGQGDYLIALDSDFDKLTPQEEHPNIIYTFGYSIENTIITDLVLNEVLCTLCKLPCRDIPESLSREWLLGLERTAKPLVLHAIVNHEDQSGCSIIPDNSDRFMKSKKSCELCEQKIKNYLDPLSIEISDERWTKIEAILNSTRLKILDLLRGHFLMSATLRWMKTETEKRKKNSVSISEEMLYSSLLLAFKSLFDSTHPHYDYYRNSLDAIIWDEKRKTKGKGAFNAPRR
ncbi:MAG: DUF4435 domain-containing protein [Microcoleaceae cyanobacterium]